MKTKRMLVMLLMIGFAGFSSYAMAQNYVFRTLSYGVKASTPLIEDTDETTAMCLGESVRSEIEEYIEEEEQITSSCTVPAGETVFSHSISRENRCNLMGDTFLYVYSYGTYAKAEFVWDSESFGQFRIENIDPELEGQDWINFIDNSNIPVQFNVPTSGDLMHTDLGGAKFYMLSMKSDYEYEKIEAFPVVKTREVEVKTENYDWCVDNGYETAS